MSIFDIGKFAAKYGFPGAPSSVCEGGAFRKNHANALQNPSFLLPPLASLRYDGTSTLREICTQVQLKFAPQRAMLVQTTKVVRSHDEGRTLFDNLECERGATSEEILILM